MSSGNQFLCLNPELDFYGFNNGKVPLSATDWFRSIRK